MQCVDLGDIFSICGGKWPFLHFYYSLMDGLKHIFSVKSQDAKRYIKMTQGFSVAPILNSMHFQYDM